MEAENLGGLLLNAQHNFAWATGGGSNGVDLSKENGTSYLLIRRDGKRFALANNIELPRLFDEEISSEHFEPVEMEWQREKLSFEVVIQKAREVLGNDQRIASDLYLHQQLQPIEGLIAKCRYVLTVAEINRYRRLCADAGIAILNAISTFEAGESETAISNKLCIALQQFGIVPIVSLVATDERIEKYRHPVPKENVWRKVLMVVVCGKREGLIANLSRLICIGEVPAELKRRNEATGYVFAKLLSATRKGVSGSDLYQIASDAYAEQNFPNEINLHHQGGATGYKSREWVIHPKSTEEVADCQAFAWNPTITGAKAEETVLAIDDGIEYLTKTPGFPQISFQIEGHDYSAPDILSL